MPSVDLRHDVPPTPCSNTQIPCTIFLALPVRRAIVDTKQADPAARRLSAVGHAPPVGPCRQADGPPAILSKVDTHSLARVSLLLSVTVTTVIYGPPSQKTLRPLYNIYWEKLSRTVRGFSGIFQIFSKYLFRRSIGFQKTSEPLQNPAVPGPDLLLIHAEPVGHLHQRHFVEPVHLQD